MTSLRHVLGMFLLGIVLCQCDLGIAQEFRRDSGNFKAAPGSYIVGFISVRTKWPKIPELESQTESIRKAIYSYATDDAYEAPLENAENLMFGDMTHAVQFKPDRFVQAFDWLTKNQLIVQKKSDGNVRLTLSATELPVNFIETLQRKEKVSGKKQWILDVGVSPKDRSAWWTRYLNDMTRYDGRAISGSPWADVARFLSYVGKEPHVTLLPFFACERDQVLRSERADGKNGVRDYLVLWPSEAEHVSDCFREEYVSEDSGEFRRGARRSFYQMHTHGDPHAWGDESAEQKTIEEAKTLRDAEQVSDEQKAELWKLVTEALDAKLKQQQAQAEQLEQRLAVVQSALKARQKSRERIIERRVEELLNPNVGWHTLQKDSTTPERQPMPGPGIGRPLTETSNSPTGIPESAHLPLGKPAALKSSLGTALTDNNGVASPYAPTTSGTAAESNMRMLTPTEMVNELKAQRDNVEAKKSRIAPTMYIFRQRSRPLKVSGGQSGEEPKRYRVEEARQEFNNLEQQLAALAPGVAEWKLVWRQYQSNMDLLKLRLETARRHRERMTQELERADQLHQDGVLASSKLHSKQADQERAAVHVAQLEQHLNVYSSIATDVPHLNPARHEEWRARIDAEVAPVERLIAAADARRDLAAAPNDLDEIELSVSNTTGESLRLDELTGKVVLITVRPSWAEKGYRDLSEYSELHNDYYDKGVQVISLHDEAGESTKVSTRVVKANMQDNEFKFQSALLPDDLKTKLAEEDLPVTYFIDRTGKTRLRIQGDYPYAYLAAVAEELLKESSGK